LQKVDKYKATFRDICDYLEMFEMAIASLGYLAYSRYFKTFSDFLTALEQGKSDRFIINFPINH